MAIDLLHGKLEKMEFRFYDKSDMLKAKETVKVMYNPNKLSLTYGGEFDKGKESPNGTPKQKLLFSCQRTLSMTLQFDGTGASPSTSILGNITSIIDKTKKEQINEQINSLLKKLNRDTHTVWNIAVVWGKIYFPCVLSSASVNYTLFRHDGVPLRGDLALTLLEQPDIELKNTKAKLLSPDLTKSYIVKAGDRLDALCETMYEDSSLYHAVARINNIKNPRKLKVGQTIMFPPIDKTEE